jgi:serine/threonine protein kinase
MKCSLGEYLISPHYSPPRDLFCLVRIASSYIQSSYLSCLHVQLGTIASGLAYLHSLKVVHGDINLVCKISLYAFLFD